MKQHEWIRQSVSRGLQALRVLNLENAPGLDTIIQTAETWTTIISHWNIGWDEQLDKARLNQAFLLLASQCERWPTPAQLRRLLPARQKTPEDLRLLSYPPEKAALNREKIAKLIKTAFEPAPKSLEQKLKALEDLQQKLRS